jgi:hypothetical protein
VRLKGITILKLLMKRRIRLMSNENGVNEKKLSAMMYKILEAEEQNLRTRAKTNDEMVETIRMIIMDEIRKNY